MGRRWACQSTTDAPARTPEPQCTWVGLHNLIIWSAHRLQEACLHSLSRVHFKHTTSPPDHSLAAVMFLPSSTGELKTVLQPVPSSLTLFLRGPYHSQQTCSIAWWLPMRWRWQEPGHQQLDVMWNCGMLLSSLRVNLHRQSAYEWNYCMTSK